MSRRRLDLDSGRYAIVGWDPPFQSFFWIIYNAVDEERMASLKANCETAEEAGELQWLYRKYAHEGGTPILADSDLGGRSITSIVQLQQSIKEHAILPPELSALLIGDQEANV